MKQSVLIVLARQPYDGTDVSWNALRLAGQLSQDGAEVRIFLVNDSVDLARDTTKTPEGFFDLVQMLKDLLAKGVVVKACGSCQARCGINKGDPYFHPDLKSNMAQFSEWVRTSDKVLSF